MPSDERTSGLILAGGQSTRFGMDKARFVIDGAPMIRHVYDVVYPFCSEVLVSVAEAGAAYPLPGSVRYVTDQRENAGPLAGLEAGLLATSTPWLLVVACDLPFVTPGLLKRLLSHRTPTAKAVVPTTPDGRIHPLCAIYHRRLLPIVQAHLDAGQRAL
ncbi:MAG: NTP transferase domain-containing protein, partial [Bacteroidetes bacterium]|nr:NTP transferase domain-containing protein [Bacteroidota bacterium]